MTGQISPALCLYLGRPCPFSASLDSDSGRKQQSLCGGALFLSTPLKLGKDALKGEATHSAAWSQGSAVPRHTPLRTPQTGSREQLLMDISGKRGVRGRQKELQFLGTRSPHYMGAKSCTSYEKYFQH
uniref:Uncharacterized protein n=1 Tax=Rousettus aegyptiacus TaxID=9407 RepID=A0A7J8BRS3_ROUAE|nr:hypothetical protein HJG63_009549 [Rousettus aegyptiacus]